MKTKKSKIIIIVAILVAIALIAGIIVAVLLLNNEEGVGDGGETTGIETEEVFEDKLEAMSKYYITVAEGEGYAVTAPEYVIKGNSCSFTVKFSNYFDSTAAQVSANGTKVTPAADGSYVVENVTEDIEISVSGLVRTHYGVIKVECLGAELIGEDRVAVDADYSFELDVAENATGTPTVTVNGEAVTGKDGVYTVSKPNKDLIIEVSGITVPTVEVTYDTTKGYTIVSSTAAVGGSLSFSVHIGSEYEAHNTLIVKVNGKTVKSVNGVYTVENAPESIDIDVQGLELREMITLSFKNCDMTQISIYKATVWQETVPTRDGYIFSGWTDEFGYPTSIDYMSDATLYASWLTEDGIDYVDELPKVANKIKVRCAELGQELWRLNVSDRELAEQYEALLKHHTEFEKSFVITDETVNTFIANTELVSSTVIGTNGFFGANENAVQLFFTADGEYQNKGASTMRLFSSGHEMNGIEYNIQNKNEDGSCVLDYTLNFGKLNFKEYCETDKKVTFWLSTNAEGLTAKAEGEYLFDAANNMTIPAGGKCALYRIDIQDQMVFVNGEYIFDLSESVYTGENEFTVALHRLDISSHTYANIHVSDIYVGAKDPSLIKVIKTSETFNITKLLHVSYVDPTDGPTEYTRTSASEYFEGDKYNIQKPISASPVLDYTFTVDGFNYKKYCDKYGSITINFLSNYAGTSVKLGSTLLFTSEADQIVTMTIQNGYVFIDGAYVCDLAEDVLNGTEALVLSIHRQPDAQWAAFHVSNINAGPKDPALVKQ